jgi:hypothetical protein
MPTKETMRESNPDVDEKLNAGAAISRASNAMIIEHR